ncbi:MAG: hypothetical protein JJ863_21790 [Deltaproteobacteria bacterium]|nr:hypothetical protein [Deltaproteobacteria bacterium]
MRELRFAKDLYEGTQVDAAVKVFERFGKLSTAEEADAWIVTVDAPSDARVRRLAGELANYALGLTIRGRQAEESTE